MKNDIVVKSINAIQNEIDVSKVKTLSEADALVRTVEQISGIYDLKKFKVFQLVKERELYKEVINGKPAYKDFETWAEKAFNVGRATAYRYVQVAAYITEDGNATVFKPESQSGVLDYTYTVLSLFVQAFGKEPDPVAAIREFIKTNGISPANTVAFIKKMLKKAGKIGGKKETDETPETDETNEDSAGVSETVETSVKTEKTETGAPVFDSVAKLADYLKKSARTYSALTVTAPNGETVAMFKAPEKD